MKQLMIATCLAGLCGVSAIAAAQDSKMNKSMNTPMKVTGCVASGAEMGQYVLNNAMPSDAANMKGAKKDDTMAKGEMAPMSYTLKGGDLKAHVGHKVEVTGTMAQNGMGTTMKDTMPKDNMPNDTMTKDMAAMHSLDVKSVKMLSATCS